jgi:hypothetical protein
MALDFDLVGQVHCRPFEKPGVFFSLHHWMWKLLSWREEQEWIEISISDDSPSNPVISVRFIILFLQPFCKSFTFLLGFDLR